MKHIFFVLCIIVGIILFIAGYRLMKHLDIFLENNYKTIMEKENDMVEDKNAAGGDSSGG